MCSWEKHSTVRQSQFRQLLEEGMELLSQSTSIRLLHPLPTPGALAEGGWVGSRHVPKVLQGLDSTISPMSSCRSASRAPGHVLKEAARLWLWPQEGGRREGG